MRQTVARLDRARRRRLLELRVRHDLTPPLPSAFARFGTGSVIVPPARVENPQCISIGRDTTVLENGWLAVYPQAGMAPPRLEIGSGVRIGRSSHISCVGEVVIGDDVLTADHVYIADTFHGYEDVGVPIRRQPMAAPKPVHIGRGAFLGIRSAILQGVTVGENAFVAAGAVVGDDVPARSVVAGNPARVVRMFDPDSGEWEPPPVSPGGVAG